MEQEMVESKFTSGYNKGFRMTFENGFAISVQWGVGNYCEKKDDGEWSESTKHDFWSSNSAEIAVFNKEGGFINIRGYEIEKEDGTIEEYDDVVSGWLSTNEVAKVIAIVSSAQTEDEVIKKVKSLNL
jgi:hypothetical protein